MLKNSKIVNLENINSFISRVAFLHYVIIFNLIIVLIPIHAENIELRIATLAPAGSATMATWQKAAAEIKEKTQGRVTVKYFEGGQQGDERDYILKINLGQLDGASVTAIGLSMIDESIRVLELPMMFANAEEVDYVADKMWPYFQQKFQKKGFHLIGREEVGWIYFLSKNKIEILPELKSQKIWVWGDDRIVSTLFKQLGVNGVPLGVPEVDSALTSGRINACYASPFQAVALQWYSKIKYATSMPVNFGIAATVISENALKKISATDRKTIEEVHIATGKKLRKIIRKANADALNTMKRKGVTVIQTSAATSSEYSKQANIVSATLAGKVYLQQDLDMVHKYRIEYRAKHKKK